MTDIPYEPVLSRPAPAPEKFNDPDLTAKGEARASVGLARLDTLWINTGSLCNIECLNCYIESGPRNDRLSYFPAEDAARLFDEVAELGLGTREIGFTGGEPFMNPDMIAMMADALGRGFEVLVLTNAMQPMMRPRVRDSLVELNASHRDRLTLRVSLDHYSATLHDTERGPGAFEKALEGLDWLAAQGIRFTIAGRTCWNESMEEARAGYARLFGDRGYPVDASDPASLVLFPEMDGAHDVPEITTACWGILGVSPADIMCATSRMVVKRKGCDRPTVMPCTLLPYDDAFAMGATLAQSMGADGGNFDRGAVKLNHSHCAKFCVLGGGSCSAG